MSGCAIREESCGFQEMTMWIAECWKGMFMRSTSTKRAGWVLEQQYRSKCIVDVPRYVDSIHLAITIIKYVDIYTSQNYVLVQDLDSTEPVIESWTFLFMSSLFHQW